MSEKEIIKSLREQSRATLPLVSEIPAGHSPGFIPTAVACGVTEIDGRPAVVLQIANAAGVSFTFLPPEIARQIAGHLDGAAHAADGGIIAPRQGAEPIKKHYTMHADPGVIARDGKPIGNGKG